MEEGISGALRELGWPLVGVRLGLSGSGDCGDWESGEPALPSDDDDGDWESRDPWLWEPPPLTGDSDVAASKDASSSCCWSVLLLRRLVGVRSGGGGEQACLNSRYDRRV